MVDDINDVAPTITSGASGSILEGLSGVVYTAQFSDSDGANHVFSLAGADANHFNIAANGEVTFKTVRDFESPADADSNNVYDITVNVFDGVHTTTKDVNISVLNRNDNAPNFWGAATKNVNENVSTATIIYNANGTDADGDTLTYSITGGADANRFTINAATGAVTFRISPDRENPADADGNNVYNVTIRISDGVYSTTGNVAITVRNLNDNTPVFTSSATVHVNENTTGVFYTAAATDADGDTLTYSIVGGNDQHLFNIGSSSGEVSFKTAPDYENPADHDSNNSYQVTIRASDGERSVDRIHAINVQNVNDNAPVITSGNSAAVNENISTATTVYTFTATDADNSNITYSISGGFDAHLFNINSSTGALTFKTSPDYEKPMDFGGNNSFQVAVRASDGVFSDSKFISIRVDDVDEQAPTISLRQLSPSQGFIIQGDDTGDWLGDSVSAAGDINGDGFEDIIVGAPRGDDGNLEAGEAYVIYGRSGWFGSNTVTAGYTRQVVDLSDLPGSTGIGFRIIGDADDDWLGRSVSSAGDVNGDGFEDMIVGAPRGDDAGGGGNSGEAYVVFGKSGTLLPNVWVSNFNASAGFIIQGAAAGDKAGRGVSSAGDINGDGYDDLIVGAPYSDLGGADSGAAYVIFGKASGFGTTDSEGRQVIGLNSVPTATGLTITGDEAFDQTGFSVSAAGDVNGDGYDDFIIGAPNASKDAGNNNEGAAYVIYGRANKPSIDLSNLHSTEGYKITGDGAGDKMGFSVSSAGDINADGYDDVIIGAIHADPNITDPDAGETYVIFGQGGNRSTVDISSLAPNAGFIIQGNRAGDDTGRSVASAGDINGDGYDDLIIGARLGDGASAGTNNGRAYIIFGKRDGFGEIDGSGRRALDLTDLKVGEGFRIIGDTAHDIAGQSVSSAGDINGDGYDDLIIGAPYGDDGGHSTNNKAGEAYVLFGGADIGGRRTSTDDYPLTGSYRPDILVGTAGNNVLRGQGSADAIHGGAGDDTIIVRDTGFRHVDGGGGYDTLAFSTRSFTYYLIKSNFATRKIENIEAIDLTGQGSTNHLVIDAVTILKMTDARTNGYAIITVDGDAGDSITFNDTGWSFGGNVNVGGVIYSLWGNGAAQVRLNSNVTKHGDPIVLDFDGDGLAFQTGADAVRFDLDADGFAEYTAWPAAGDGVLVMDRDGSGVIEDGREVVSENFAEGGFANSLDALISLDENGDGVLDRNDSAFADLQVWNDLNQDGVSQAGELATLDQLGIRSFDLAAAMIEQSVDGQRVFAKSGAETNDGGVVDFYAIMLASRATPMGADGAPSPGAQETAEIYMINQQETTDAPTLNINIGTYEWDMT